jgi:polyisoprenoid-binding protein YceI
VVFGVKFNGAGVNPLDNAYTVGFEVRGQIKRSDFGVAKYVPLVGDDVELVISAAFERK